MRAIISLTMCIMLTLEGTGEASVRGSKATRKVDVKSMLACVN